MGYGHGPANPASEYLTSSSAIMSGLLTMNMVRVSAPSTGGFWTLPRHGNIYQISTLPESGATPCTTSYVYISRINHLGPDRFDSGSVITLLFPTCNENCVPCLGLTNSVFLNLLGGTGFAPTTPQSSITLVSNGDGTWNEVSR